jgi:hypothetical protein
MALPDYSGLDVGAWTTVLSTELNSLADANGALSAAVTVNNDWDYMQFELDCGFGAAPTADQAIEIWIVQEDSSGTPGYEDGAGGATPVTSEWLAHVFRTRAATSLKRITGLLAKPPQGASTTPGYKVLLVQKTAQTMSASGNTLKVRHVRAKITDA